MAHAEQEYRRIANETVKPLVERTARELSALESERMEIQELHDQLQSMAVHKAAHPGKPYKTLSDLGEGFFAQARVDDLDVIAVHVGAGVYPQLTLAEAQEYIGKRLALLDQAISKKRDALIDVQADWIVARAALGSLSEQET